MTPNGKAYKCRKSDGKYVGNLNDNCPCQVIMRNLLGSFYLNFTDTCLRHGDFALENHFNLG